MTRVLDPRFAPWIGCGAALFAIAITWQVGLRPSTATAHRAAAEAEALSTRIAAMDVMVQAAGGAAPWQRAQDARLRRLQARLPQQEQLPGLLNAIDGVFRQGTLSLINLNQGGLEPALENGVPVVVGPGICYRLPLTVNAQGRYADLVGALEQLTGDAFPGLVSVEELQLRRAGDGPKVDATISLTVYVTGLAQ